MESCLSLVSFYSSYLHRSFLSAGFQPQTFDLDDGETTLHCWVPRPDPSNAHKPVVLLIHGFGPAATWQWRYQVRSLSRHFRLLVPDLVFFGQSTTRSSHRSEVFQAECLIKLLDMLGVVRFSAVGTSYGGFVAYHIARICGDERVERVVIASSDLMKREEDNDGLLERAGFREITELMLPRSAAAVRTLLGLAIHRPPPLMPDFVLRDVVQTLYTDNRDEKVELIEGIALDKSDGLEQLFQEVLIVWGEHDNIFPLEKAYKIRKQIGETVSLEVMKNTSHMPQAEDPRQFNHIIINFLLGTSKSSI